MKKTTVVAKKLLGKRLVRKINKKTISGIITEIEAYLNDDPASPEIVLVFSINIPSGVELPGGIGPLTPEQALSFTPPTGDLVLSSHPPVDYSGLGFSNPIAHTTPWTADNPEEPIHFTFLVFQNVESSNSETHAIYTTNYVLFSFLCYL